jgi:microcystin-dependent protein
VYGAPASAPTTLHPSTIQSAGSSNPHNNMQPYLCINFIISLFGIFPTQS